MSPIPSGGSFWGVGLAKQCWGFEPRVLSRYIRRPCLALATAGRRMGPPLVWNLCIAAPLVPSSPEQQARPDSNFQETAVWHLQTPKMAVPFYVFRNCRLVRFLAMRHIDTATCLEHRR